MAGDVPGGNDLQGARKAGPRLEDEQNIPAPSFESLENTVLHNLRLIGVHGVQYRIASYLAGNLDDYGT